MSNRKRPIHEESMRAAIHRARHQLHLQRHSRWLAEEQAIAEREDAKNAASHAEKGRR